MAYSIIPLTPRLIFIRWQRTPLAEEAKNFVQTLQNLLDQASNGLYFLSDLRHGRIVDVRIIQQLSQLTAHPQWAGSTAFSQNMISNLFLGSFQRLLDKNWEKNTTFNTPEEAITFLEHLSPGLTEGIDWEQVLNSSPNTAE